MASFDATPLKTFQVQKRDAYDVFGMTPPATVA